MWFGDPHCLPKEFLLPDLARRDNQGKKGDHVEYNSFNLAPIGLEKCWIIKYAALSNCTCTDISYNR